ncbi:Sodium-coupled monocarboxylate transporter 2 [Armadillidium vulgare]|nr:Sodium-coupled monocarboxylate transporter 2 [Armadillidium vulgare]
MYFLILSCGVVAYSTFAGCDPMAMGIIKKKEQIIPYFVMNKLNYIGLPGIFVGTIIGASMSSISSTINGSVAQIWRDVFLRFDHFKTASPSYSTLINKIISLVIGFMIIGLAILSSKGGGVVEISLAFAGLFNGPIFGVFLVGFLLPRMQLKRYLDWIHNFFRPDNLARNRRLFYRKRTKMLPFSADECNPLNMTSLNMNMTSLNMNMTSLTQQQLCET